MEQTTKLLTQDFKQAVSITNRFVPLRPTLPVLGNILMKSTKTNLELAATNLENSIKIKLKSSGTDWETTVPAKVLAEFANSLNERETNLSLIKDSLQIKTSSIVADINTIASSEFPTLPQAETQTKKEVSQKLLYDFVSRAAFAASADPSKPILNGLLLRPAEKGLEIVTTDSYRLTISNLGESYSISETIVPARTFVDGLKIAGELDEDSLALSTAAANNQLFLSGERFELATRLIDGTYPAFESIIPTKFPTKLVGSKKELAEKIKTAAVFARDIGNVIKLTLSQKGSVKIAANTAQVGQAEADLAAEVTGEDLVVAFNSGFLLDGLSSLTGDQVEISFSGALSPAIMTEPDKKDYRYIVMPVKAQK